VRGNIHTRLDRLEAMTPAPSGSPEDSVKMVEAVETLKDLILENGDEIDCGYRERIGRREEHLDALIAAKQAVWERTAEGRAALDVLDAVRDRGGGTGYEPL
jgi:porphobilinogen deaminase